MTEAGPELLEFLAAALRAGGWCETVCEERDGCEDEEGQRDERESNERQERERHRREKDGDRYLETQKDGEIEARRGRQTDTRFSHPCNNLQPPLLYVIQHFLPHL